MANFDRIADMMCFAIVVQIRSDFAFLEGSLSFGSEYSKYNIYYIYMRQISTK